MTQDELRALAEALQEMIWRVSSLDDICDLESAADYLRHCAERRPDGWKLVPVEPTPEMWEAGAAHHINVSGDEDGDKYAAIGCAVATWKGMLAAAPAAQQAEPPRQAGQEISLGALMREQRQSRIVAGAFPDGNPAAKAMIAQTPQAEPKRKLSDEQIASVCISYRHDFGLLDRDEQARLMLEARDWERAFRKEWQREPLSDDDINKLAWKQNLWTDHMIEFSFLAFAREVERAHGIGGSDDTK